MVVLMVEDNPLSQELLTVLLEMAGHSVLPANSGEMALEIARSQPVDMILMDLSLPGKDGLTVTAELKADPATCEIPVVAVTAHSRAEDRERIVASGCAGYVIKPIEVETFVSELEKFYFATGP
jgi:two-component system cell cycle response regulator DivK